MFNYIDRNDKIKDKNSRKLFTDTQQKLINLIQQTLGQNIKFDYQYLKSQIKAVFIPTFICNIKGKYVRYLLVSQPAYNENRIELCKGLVNVLTENVEEACLRELKEELQININKQQLWNGTQYQFLHDQQCFNVFIFQLKQYQFEQMSLSNKYGAISNFEAQNQVFINLDFFYQTSEEAKNNKEDKEAFVFPFTSVKLRNQVIQSIKQLKLIYPENYLPKEVLNKKDNNQNMIYVKNIQK